MDTDLVHLSLAIALWFYSLFALWLYPCRQLVEGRHADDVRWMKHKAYYKGVAKVRAAKKQLEQLEAEEADEAAAAAAAGGSAAQASKQQPSKSSSSSSRHKPHNRLAMYSEGELLEEVSDPSEWEQGWNESSYANHPEVLQQLRSAFAGSLGLPYVSPQQQAKQEAAAAAAAAEVAVQQARAAELAAAREAFLAKHSPYQVGGLWDLMYIMSALVSAQHAATESEALCCMFYTAWCVFSCPPLSWEGQMQTVMCTR
jgi:hypothetical protein